MFQPKRGRRREDPSGVLYAFDASFVSGRCGPLAGADEAGRGALAGPIVAAAVVLGQEKLAGLNDSKALGQALRLSAEFVSGVAAGGILGWLVDRLFGIAPWGLIVCLILGFCAGMLNLMRAAGVVKAARYDDKR